ncbi:NrfD/PsrC family molybdoenzyme membrane anchor subunit [Geodermatophilus obscurus]|uniref:Polysulphide reductase NrfD n=1 Tax=Geodermatophilus obscurus (strain ATCC 25078 / DSM 43160 / JCM 3152 / CCUG 61914 / KCC A-0152 / KCTC 9177 / NBRC 13315 / NRRL B-3577 / G-20) TaxID=526225 RepID=D2S531_GEOOG|nr:NrfD/PsrC family molybdoenzyme membrane anchor subunit [Geodermatophilus obscurus]ADB73142.1 Polysulphide reductase NrfD [Geodermatophilus obscurus DSM 43160]
MTEGITTPGAGWRRADGPPAQKRQKRRRRRGGGRPGGEVAMVEEAEFTSYYGRPIIKPPVWKTPDVPLYLFLGGAAGSSSIMAALTDLTDRPALTRNARYVSGGAAIASVVFLVHDLGRPERFLHMLRVIKPTSPLSIGSYILAPFSAAAGATAAVELLGWFPRLKRFGGVVAALFGGPLATYTGVLFSNTAVPSWHAAYKELPFVFGASGMAAGGGITMALSPIEEAGPSRKMAVAGAAIELAAMHRVETGFGIVSEPYHEGKAGRLLRAAKSCTAAGAALTVVAGRRRAGAVAAGALLAAGSLLTRFGVFEAGMASARDPKYTVVPQRERLAARGNGPAPSVTR